MKIVGCKHLDYDEAKYPTCELVTIQPQGWRYWKRLEIPYDGAPINVQFCGQGRGRINGIFQCINPGEMTCFEKDA